MKIYETSTAPNPRRVRIFLAEKQIDVEYVQVALQPGDNLSAEFRKKNPWAKVPVLELDDGTCISETIAICRYFEEIQPEPALMGRTALEKAQIEMWQRRMELTFLLPTGMCFQHTTGYFADRMTPISAWGEECHKQVEKMYAKLDKLLAQSEYIAGDAFTIADITALCTVDFNRVNKIKIQPDQTHLKRWYDLVSSRPSAKA
jgi:glutathione S-transferase